MKIKLKNDRDLEMLRISGKILAEVLRILKDSVGPGVKLIDLDNLASQIIKKRGARPAFLGYHPEGAANPYPASICASVNQKIVHGRPDNYALKKGDVLKIDAGVNYNGYFTDAAITVGIGSISPEAKKLIKITKAALEKAIEICQPGNRLGDIGWVIEKTAKTAGFSVAEGLTGHGVGFELHEEPTIYNYGEQGSGLLLKPGMVLAIEPMLAIGAGAIKRLADDSFETKDGSLSAHFEHTIAITRNGPEVLTK